MIRWINSGQTSPQRWARKGDMPKHWQRIALRVCFTFEIAWIARDDNGNVYMQGVEWAPAFDFRLKTPGHVIGLRDMATADCHDWAHEWRSAMHDRIMERLSMQH